MKKKIVALLLVVLLALGITACGNKDLWDTNYTFDRAIISLGNGETIEVEIKQWKDYEGEQIQIIDKAGNVYLVSTFNCVLINDNEDHAGGK